MNYYVSTPTGARCLAACRAHGYREFACPVRGVMRGGVRRIGRRGVEPHLERVALDNGAWLFHVYGKPADFGPFADALQSIGERCDFVVAPDIVAGGLASLALSESWISRCLDASPVVLIPVQDGMHTDDVRGLLGPRVGVFVGGSTAWKWTTVPEWARIGVESGAHVHVGRVNTERRARLCADLGVTSADGSTVARFSITAHRMADAVNPHRQSQRNLL